MAGNKMINDDEKSSFLGVTGLGSMWPLGEHWTVTGGQWKSHFLRRSSSPSCSLCQVASLPGKADLSWLFYYKAGGSARADAKPVRLLGHQEREGVCWWAGWQGGNNGKQDFRPQLAPQGISQCRDKKVTCDAHSSAWFLSTPCLFQSHHPCWASGGSTRVKKPQSLPSQSSRSLLDNMRLIPGRQGKLRVGVLWLGHQGSFWATPWRARGCGQTEGLAGRENTEEETYLAWAFWKTQELALTAEECRSSFLTGL